MFKKDNFSQADFADLIEIPMIQNDVDLMSPYKLELLTCNICQNDYFTGDIQNYRLDCGHYMHFECFRTYTQNQVLINKKTLN